MIENLFISAGVMKGGTTWLYSQLRNHKDIYFTPEKEIHYFANINGIEDQLNHQTRIAKFKEKIRPIQYLKSDDLVKGMDEYAWYAEYARPSTLNDAWYESLFRFSAGRRYCADFSNLYAQLDDAGWEHIRRVAKNTRVIYTIRDPLKRIWSHYKFHMFWIGRGDEVISAGFGHFRDLVNQSYFWNNALYARNYETMRRNLDDDSLALFYFEDFRKDPVEMLNRICRFLDIEEIPFDKKKIEERVNATADYSFPVEWMDYVKEKLKPEVERMKELGIYHDEWSDT